MILTTHLLVGAVIASRISNPFLALPLAFLSHYFLDSLPHKDYYIAIVKQRRWNNAFSDFFKVFIDISLGTSLVLMFSENNPVIFAAIFLSLVPDGITLLSIVFPQNKLLIKHQKIHMAVNSIGDAEANKKIPTPLGICGQAAVVLTAILGLISR